MSWVGSTDNTGALRVNVVAGGGGGGGGGNVVITNPLPLPVTVGNFPVVAPITGTVAVSNFPATQAVTGTFFQATQPISGTVDVNNFPATQPISGTVAVSNFPATQAVTGTFFQATQPISGTVDVNNFPATQPISGTVAVSNLPPQQTVGFADTTTDAFSRLRVGLPQTLFNVQMQYDLNPQFMERGATGTGLAATFDSNVRIARLTVNPGTGTSFMQSYQYVPYQPGKSQLAVITFVFGAPVGGVVKEVGYFDSFNGIFLRQNGSSGLQIVRRSSTSGIVEDFALDQLNWNLDTFDGNGPSALVLDTALAQILIIDLQFLGMGRVRVGFDINGIVYYAHEFRNANVLAVPYMQTASLPIQILVSSTGSLNISTVLFKCAAVICEGSFDRRPDLIQSTGNVTATAGNNTRVHLLSIRPSALFQGVVNRTNFLPSQLNLLVTGATPVYYEMGTGATFSVQPTWTPINAGLSAFEIGVGGTLSALPNVFESGHIPSTTQSRGALTSTFIFTNPINLNRAGAQRIDGIVTIAITGLGATSVTHGSVDFEEYR